MLQIPRPWVAASNVLPSGFSRRLLIEVLGRFVPKRDQVVPLPCPASAMSVDQRVAWVKLLLPVAERPTPCPDLGKPFRRLDLDCSSALVSE